MSPLPTHPPADAAPGGPFTRSLARHLFTLASAVSLLLSLAVCALWLIWMTLLVRQRPAPAGRGGGALAL